MSKVRITVEIHRDGDRRRLMFNDAALKVDIDLWRCDRCAALTLREESPAHEVFHEGQDSRMEAIEERLFGS